MMIFHKKQKDNTRLSEEDIYNILCRRKLVEKYAVRAAQQVKSDGFAEEIVHHCLIMMENIIKR